MKCVGAIGTHTVNKPSLRGLCLRNLKTFPAFDVEGLNGAFNELQYAFACSTPVIDLWGAESTHTL